MSDPRIYRYVVRYDGGTAPNPLGGYCTLAICKPAIRRTARLGDWVVGFRSRDHERVVYAMEVAESLTFAEYWSDVRFRSRRPDDPSAPTDNIYRPRPDRVEGEAELEWVPNEVHDAGSLAHDTGGKRVLVATRFWYFGGTSPKLPTELTHLSPVGRGHVVHASRRDGDLERFMAWLTQLPPGMSGRPIDAGTARWARGPELTATDLPGASAPLPRP